MSWFIVNLLAVVALAAAELTQQHLLNLKYAYSERTIAVLIFLCQALLAIPLIFILGEQNQIYNILNPNVLFKVIFVTFLSSISMVFYLRSFKVKNISFSTIFATVSIPIGAFLGIIVFKESTSIVKFLGILLIMLSIISLNFKNAALERNHFFGLLAGIMFGVLYVFNKSILMDINPLTYIICGFFLVAFWGFLLNPMQVITSVRSKPISALVPVVISGICYFLYNFFSFNAYRLGGEVGKVDAINNSQIFLIILFEFIILKHKGSFRRKLLTAILAYSGVFILGFF